MRFWGSEVSSDYDYYSPDAEAVVYMIMPSGKCRKNCLYVMKRKDAVAFCSRPETRSANKTRAWAYSFSTYKRNWREELDAFRVDDGRFAPLLKELGITPIFVKTRE